MGLLMGPCPNKYLHLTQVMEDSISEACCNDEEDSQHVFSVGDLG